MSIGQWWRNRGRNLSQFPGDENGDVLWQMHKAGDDLSKRRRMNFAFVFQSERDARAFQPKAEALGFEVEVSFFAAKNCWDAECSVEMTPTHRRVSSIESELSILAASDGGSPDGWGCIAK